MICGVDCAKYVPGGGCTGCAKGYTGFFTPCNGLKCFSPKPKMATKRCTRCGRELPIDDFPANKNAKDGHLSVCKECNFKARSESRKAKFAPPVQQESMKNDTPAPTEPTDGTQVFEPKFRDARPIHLFSDQELWNELKGRGYSGSITKTVTLE